MVSHKQDNKGRTLWLLDETTKHRHNHWVQGKGSHEYCGLSLLTHLSAARALGKWQIKALSNENEKFSNSCSLPLVDSTHNPWNASQGDKDKKQKNPNMIDLLKETLVNRAVLCTCHQKCILIRSLIRHCCLLAHPCSWHVWFPDLFFLLLYWTSVLTPASWANR